MLAEARNVWPAPILRSPRLQDGRAYSPRQRLDEARVLLGQPHGRPQAVRSPGLLGDVPHDDAGAQQRLDGPPGVVDADDQEVRRARVDLGDVGAQRLDEARLLGQDQPTRSRIVSRSRSAAAPSATERVPTLFGGRTRLSIAAISGAASA